MNGDIRIDNFKLSNMDLKSCIKKDNENDENIHFNAMREHSETQDVNLDSLSKFNDFIIETLSDSNVEQCSSDAKDDFGKIQQISDKKFEVESIDGVDTYEFDNAPVAKKQKDGSIVYSGIINGKKANFVVKNGKAAKMTFFNDDKLDSEVKYSNSAKEVKHYYTDGKTVKFASSENLDGSYDKKWFYENGKLKEENLHETGNNPRTIVKQYYENGRLKLESYESLYSGINEKQYYESGKLKSNKKIDEDGAEEYKSYYENGITSSEYYKNSEGRKTLYKGYDKKGRVQSIELNNGEVRFNIGMLVHNEKHTSDGIEYEFTNGDKIIMHHNGEYSVTIDGITKKYNKKSEPTK